MRTHATLIFTLLLLSGCSDGSQPPVLGDPSSTTVVIGDDASATTEPCSGSPAKGCPCTTAGEQVYCGIVYRISGSHVDCSKGYLTCQADGHWSSCEGAKIFGGE